MKFRTHTTLYPMTMRDVEDASKQGGMLPINIGGRIYGQSVSYRPVETKIKAYELQYDMPIADMIVATGTLVLGLGALVFATIVLWIARRRYKAQSIVSSEPLLSAQDEHSTTSRSEGSTSSLHIYNARGTQKELVGR